MSLNLYNLKRSGNSDRMPEFLRRRMDHFYLQRWRKDWRGRHIMRGATPGKDSIQLVSNDYLALANHPEIVSAQIESLQSSGQGVLMSAIFLHGDNPQARLENDLADYAGFSGAVLCQSGYAANTGLLQAIADESVPVYIDMIAHASLWEGIHSAGATARPFRHNDLDHLERQLRKYGPGVLCVDSVYSTNGSLCPLREMVELGRSHGCLVVVDESHSLGVFGPRGGGLVRELGLESSVDFMTASLAKAFAGRAGVVLCPKEFVDYFCFTSRPAIFSSCLLPHEIAGMARTLEIIRRDEWRREALMRNAQMLREGLDELGYNVDESQSQIIALEAGLEADTQALREALEKRDIFASVFCAPATGTKRSLLRLSVHAALGRGEIRRILDACADVRDETGMASWPSTKRKQQRRKAVRVAI